VPERFLLDLLSTAVPLVVGGFLAGLFTYVFERRRIRLERAARRAVLLESLRRELAFVPESLPAYRAGAVHFLPPIRTIVGGQLLDGQVLDYHTDALLIQPLLEFLGVAAIYNDLVVAVNAGQAGNAWSEDIQRHWHGQLLGVHGSLIGTRRALLDHLSGKAGPPLASKPADSPVGPIPGPDDGWRVDLHHSRVGFSAKHMGIVTVHGHFTRADVRLNLDDLDPTRSAVEARIEAASVDTSDERRDADLRSARFLDVATFPWIVFVSTAVERVGPDRYQLAGDLTIRDLTRTVSLDMQATVPIADGRGGLRRGFSVTGQINRTDWGLTWNVALETGAWLVSEEVQIELEIAAFGPAATADRVG
jgi:polyisoprenoid-binding protein YceI